MKARQWVAPDKDKISEHDSMETKWREKSTIRVRQQNDFRVEVFKVGNIAWFLSRDRLRTRF